MKRKIFIILLSLCFISAVYAANTITYPMTSGLQGRITIAMTQDLNDLSIDTRNVLGELSRISISTTPSEAGDSDPNFAVILTDDTGVALFTKVDCNSLVAPLNYAFYQDDTEGNPHYGFPVSGPLTLSVADVNSSIEVQTLDPNGAATAGPFTLSYLGETTVHINEVVTLTEVNEPNGGTFKLTFGAQETGAIDYDCTAAELDTALEALTSIDANQVVCTGGPFPDTPIVVTFSEGLGWQNVGAITLSTNALTATVGGETASYAITVTTAGQGLVFGSTTAAIETALEALSTVNVNDITVGGATLAVGTGTTFTFLAAAGDVQMITIDDTYLTGPTENPIVETNKGGFDLVQITVDLFYKPYN